MVGANGIGESIDRKFTIDATCREHDHHYDEHHAVLMLAKDKAVPATLRFYFSECVRLGAGHAQLDGIRLLIERVDRYQAANPSVLKVADVDEERGAHIIAPNNPA
jgi:hypothetical protein